MKLISKVKRNLGLKKDNVLIVDDVKSNIDLIDSYLKLIKGVKSYGIINPISAEKLISEIDFSLIILDIQMPIIDGYELAIKIKTGTYNKNKNTPIMFVTGIYNSEIDKMKGYNIGSIDYIIKPIIFEDFLKKVKKYIGIDKEKISMYRISNIKKSINM